jgi:uncharacterized protein
MRIVLDTNIALSGLLWRGAPYRVLAAARAVESARLYSSVWLLGELARVLTRPVPSRRLALLGLTARDALRDYADSVEIVATGEPVRYVVADPDDDHVIAAALAAGADWIVSGDSDLLNLRNAAGIEIVDAAEALLRLRPLP